MSYLLCPPIKLIAKERTAVKKTANESQAATDTRKDTMAEWPKDCEKSEKGRQTYALINNEIWINRN